MHDDVTVRLTVVLRSGGTAEFGPYPLNGTPVETAEAGIGLHIGSHMPYSVQVTPPGGDSIVSLRYAIRGPMANFESVIGPDSGRWFMNNLHATSFWRFAKRATSTIDDVRMPLYLFTGRDRRVELAMGVIGSLVETQFQLLEPVSNRALNVHTRGVEVAIERGSAEYPLDAAAGPGPVTESIYVRQGGDAERLPWLAAMREFSEHTRTAYGLQDRQVPASLEPFWCSWVDWASDDINEDMVLANVETGLDLGVRNFIIDDGWFGPGLDTSYDTPLNIGDWQPDPAKFPDMHRLVKRIESLGARAIIWCAPHAVGPRAEVYPSLRHLLIATADGEPILGETQFYSLCFMSAEARERMVEVCTALARDWGFHGVKYDLFNWIPQTRCSSPGHRHDIESNLVGLRAVFAEADRRIRALRPDYVVELKQNYGTAFLSPFGTCMRAGDAPFDPATNFLRTLHVQAYTPFSLNDYQTFTRHDSPADVATAVIKMLAAGIPSYGSDFTRLDEDRRAVIRWHHRMYQEHIDGFAHFRTTDDPGHGAMRVSAAARDLVFVVEPYAHCAVGRPTMVFNGSYADALVVDPGPVRTARVHHPDGTADGDWFGLRQGTQVVAVPPGSCLVLGDPRPGSARG